MRHALVGVCLFLAPHAFAAETPIPEKVREALQDRNYTAALAAIDEALKAPNAPIPALDYLRAKTLSLAGKHTEAATAFAEVAVKHAKLPLARQAKFGEALAKSRLGDYRAAEVIYRDLAVQILSEDRQQETADLYLEFADLYFKPPKENVKPDYAKALAFYKKALEAGPKPDKRIAVELLVARCHQELGQHQEAVNLLAAFVKANPKAPNLVDALYRLGDSHLKLNQRREARRVWQDLLADHAKADDARIPEAMYGLGKTYGMPTPGNDEELELGVAALDGFVKKYPSHKLAPLAALEIAQGYANRGRSEQAVAALQRLLKEEKWAKSDEVADARVQLGDMFARQKKFDDAVAAFNDYLSKHPAHKAWSGVQAKIIETEYAKAHERFDAKDFDEARKLWEAFLAKYPLYPRAPDIMLGFGKMNFDRGKYQESISDLRRLVAKYPGTDASSWGQYRIAETLETKLKQPEEALKEYRAVTWGAAQADAGRRVAWLTSKGMVVATERVFRTNETPAVKLTSRNIDAFTVRAWSVDLETYFRKMHLARGVEALDVSLIDPDKSFDYKPEGYAEYREIDSAIPLDIRGSGEAKEAVGSRPGVYAVTVASKSLEATTLVIRSDLEILVKASRNEVFVFAQNLRTGKPWPKAKLLFSNGSKVFAEGETGADGVFQRSFEDLKTAGDVRVFAVSDGHTASNVIGLQGLGVATGVQPRGYLYTDRPGYRAGQLVHIRGVIRDVANDEYTVPKGRKLTVDVFDPRNRTLVTNKIALGEFGGFHSHVILPPASPPGVYRITAREEDGRSYETSFQVAEYRLEPLRLTVDVPRSVYYRGETIEGTIVAAYYYGVPAADREVRYQLQGADEPMVVGRTDAEGKLKFSFPTRKFRESQTLTLAASLPEFNIQTAKNFVLSTVGFNIAVKTPRSVYVQGESFEAAFTAKDAEGKPLGTKLTLRVMERTLVNGLAGERQIESREATTDAKTGQTKATFTLAKGATYVLRAEGVDRFGNTITGEHNVVLSDDKDKVRLRILAEQLTFKVGDAAEVVVHWRDEPALALVAYQGAKVLGYQLVELSKGANRVKLPVTAALAPNFELAVNVMADLKAGADLKTAFRLHQANTPVTVERDLKLKLVVKRKDGKAGPPAPGDDVEVTVMATDAQGKPVSAEIGLAAVEQALLDQFGASPSDNPIGAFFLGANRQMAVRTGSSVTFAYRPQTRGISAQLLAEAEREAVDRMEANARDGAAAALADVEAGGVPADAARRSVAFGADNYTLATIPAPPGPAGGMGGGGGFGAQSNRPASPQSATMGRAGGGRFRGAKKAQTGDEKDKELAGEMLARNQLRADSKGELGEQSVVPEIPSDQLMPQTGKFNAYFADSDFELGYKAARVEELRKYAENGQNEVQVWRFSTGDYGNVNFNKRLGAIADKSGREAALQLIVKEVEAGGGVIVPNRGPQETAYWNPSVVTDAAGNAVVTFALPERSTAWRLIAKGVTQTTLAGEADETIVAKKSLFGELKLPLAFTDGDKTEVEASVVSDAEGDVTVTLTATVGEKKQSETKKVKGAKGRTAVRFPIAVAIPENAGSGPESEIAFTLTVEGGGNSDVQRRVAPVLPYGLSVFDAEGGSADSDATVFVAAPAGMPIAKPGLQILVGPSVERSLLDVLFGTAPWCQVQSARLGSGVESTVSDLQAGLALQRLMGGTRDAGNPQIQAIDGRIRSAISTLVASQSEAGGWVWANAKAGDNSYTTSRVLWALMQAKKAGYAVPQATTDKAVNFLRTLFPQIPTTDGETTSVVLHALATAGQGDFAVANRLHRSRPSLSNAGLAYLALTFVEMDRKQMAAELLALLEQRGFHRDPIAKCLPWNSGEAELRALVALAEQKVNPSSPRIKPQVDWLLAHRVGHRWAPDKATGVATLALSEWFAKTRSVGEKFRLDVFVNGALLQAIDIDDDSQTKLLDVPADRLAKDGKQRVQFRVTGRGRYTYQCMFGGFVPAGSVKSTDNEFHVHRTYEPAPLEVDGKPVARGFDVLEGSYSSFTNPLTQLPVGQRGVVRLSFPRQRYNESGPRAYPYLVVTEPIPAGCTVDEKSIQGGFERYELGAGAITFYLGAQYSAGGHFHIGDIVYTLVGYVPGEFRAGPTVLRDAYRPERLMAAGAATLKVLPMGAKSADPYRLSPRELFELGKIEFEKKNYRKAGEHLTELFGKWNLNAASYKEAARILLETHLEVGPPGSVVKYFEIIKEKYPDLEISFAKIVKVGAAYHEMGEYERSFLIFRATVEAAFQKESEAAGFLEGQGEFLRSVAHMRRLTSEFPPEPYVAGAAYALAQRVYAKAPEAAGTPKLREKKIGRTELTRMAVGMLDDFLTQYPDDPAADQAAFALANGLLDMKAYKQAIARCNKYADRYKASDILDSYWYVVGFSHFALGETGPALEMCRKVAEHKRKDRASGREVESANKWQATYILGQVYHSLGKAAEAVGEYTKVADRFADAKQAIEFFMRREVTAPEVSTVKPGEPAKLALKFRNVPSVEVKAYRIDLMKFGLLRRDLNAITAINLAGIRPYYEAVTKLGDGKDYRDREHALELPLKDVGAYLVVCRADDLYTSGLVLVTPLTVEVQEEAESGRVRATVKNTVAGKYLPNTQVRVIGTSDPDFIAGATDLRGVFVADGVDGRATVICRADEGYAFHRGKTHLGQTPPPQTAAPQIRQQTERKPAAAPQSQEDALLDNVRSGNRFWNDQGQQKLKQIYDNPKKGIEAKAAY